MPFAFRIPGDGTNTWAGSTASVQHVPSGPGESWSYDTELGLEQASAYDVVASFLTWCNAGGRAWSGAVTFTATWGTPTTTTRRASVRMTASAGVRWQSSADFRALTGVPSGITIATTWDLDELVGSVAGEWVVRDWFAYCGQKGTQCRAGSNFWGRHGDAPNRPGVSAVLTPAEAYALAVAQDFALSPRQAHVYQTHTSTWRLVDVAGVKVKAPRAGERLHTVAVTALG